MNGKEIIVVREKYWDEKTTEEKLEVLKDSLAMLGVDVGALEMGVGILGEHEHNSRGEIVVKVDTNKNRGMLLPQTRNEAGDRVKWKLNVRPRVL